MKINYIVFIVLLLLLLLLNVINCSEVDNKEIERINNIINNYDINRGGENNDKINSQKILPKITQQDIENIKLIRKLDIIELVKAMSHLDSQDFALGLIVGLEKSIMSDPTQCIDLLRTSMNNTNLILNYITNFNNITVNEILTLLQLFPTVIRDDISLYNKCGVDKIVGKLREFFNIIKSEGFSNFVDKQKAKLNAHPFSLIPITRGIIEGVIKKNYQMLGVNIGEYIGILIKFDE